ncbi:MAG: glycerophosphoryl diester phosphodiesterase, partial [Gammaproteobacteria bacterium]
MKNNDMWIIGHRGAAGMRPENTLLAVSHAL